MADHPVTRLQDIKNALAERGLAPQKKFGQNFMADPNFANAVARDAGVDEKTLVIEIGPGTGCLTSALLAAHPQSRVLAVEIDRGLAALLRETFETSLNEKRLTLIEGDALDGKHQLAAAWVNEVKAIRDNEKRSRLVLCANLPYNAATPILANLAMDDDGLAVSRAIATIQYELAERLFARPGDSNYGALSALLALRSTGSIIRKVGGGIFWPKPQVDSGVIGLDFLPWNNAGLQRSEADGFQDFLQRVFSQRRKMLRAVLKPAQVSEQFAQKRAEELSPHELLNLYRETRAAT
jgi:16S rRNA (adenine1518-N6/adenine1519-N6)-dimethyltransferase